MREECSYGIGEGGGVLLTAYLSDIDESAPLSRLVILRQREACADRQLRPEIAMEEY